MTAEIRTVNKPDGLHIAENACYEDRTLRRIDFPEGGVSIDHHAFAFCEALEEVIIPDSVEMICAGAFEGCTALKRVVMADSVRIIQKRAFANCRALEELELSGTLQTISEEAMIGCDALRRLFIPKSLNRIGRHAFPKTEVVLVLEEGSQLEERLQKRGIRYEKQSVETEMDKKIAQIDWWTRVSDAVVGLPSVEDAPAGNDEAEQNVQAPEPEKEDGRIGDREAVAEETPKKRRGKHKGLITILKDRYPQGAQFRTIKELREANPDLEELFKTNVGKKKSGDMPFAVLLYKKGFIASGTTIAASAKKYDEERKAKLKADRKKPKMKAPESDASTGAQTGSDVPGVHGKTDDGPFLFISYAHKDKETVIPVLEGLMARGYRLWYDGHLNVGAGYAAEITRHINRCEAFVLFVSKSYSESRDCKNEIHLANQFDRDLLPIYLERDVRDDELEYFLVRANRLYADEYGDTEALIDKLIASSKLDVCRS